MAVPVTEPVPLVASVIIPTRDRPDFLRTCLHSLAKQNMPNPFEIIVVDNNPGSGKTPPVVREFPGVRLIEEPTRGTSAARNAGFVAARAEIGAMVDDDVVASESWLTTLIAPFARKDVALVCGNTLPSKLDRRAEKRFESFGGLGRGFTRFELGPDWFLNPVSRSVRIWEIGATANCAVRRSVLADSEVGLMDELLGPGTPASACEDLYFYYRIAKRGHTMVYEPNAYVFHSHRTTMRALRRQIYNYAKGHYAHQLNTLHQDRDFRAILQLLVNLPIQCMLRTLGLRRFPRSLILPDILGSLAGPFAYALTRIRGRPRPPLQLDRSSTFESAHQTDSVLKKPNQ
jgi:GT2 family glycosyltransferase